MSARAVGGRGARRTAPQSMADYALSRGGTYSVTDLVAPVWCEYAAQYNVLGMSHLPVSQRPAQIATPQGNVVSVDVGKAQQREKVLDAGRIVHRRLEDEIHPVRVYVETVSREDEWGLRLLQLVSGLRVLMESGCCRELPVFGLVEGLLVFGVIDELKIHYYPQMDGVGGGVGRTWSSQEEWRNKSTVVQKRPKRDTRQRTLAAFIPGVKDEKAQTKEQDQTPARFGFVLEDAKTRRSMHMPDAEDQKQSRLQCMLYKRLLDGLIAGLARDTLGANLDEHATPVSAAAVMALVGLQGNADLSETFLVDAEGLCDSLNLSLRVKTDTQGRQTCDLAHLFDLLATTLDDLTSMAQRGAANREDFSVIQDELRLTYRPREARWSKRKAKPALRSEDLDEEAQVELALQISLESSASIEEEQLNSASIALPVSPTRTPTKATTIIGTSRFQHDSHLLQEHLIDVMAMWKGERPLKGVTLQQTWRCHHCEYLNDCEWRHQKAEEGLQRARDKRLADEEQALWSQVDDVPADMEW